MNPEELEFLAEKEMIEIIPKFSLDEIYLVDGTLGPFNAGIPALVPLWVALDLRRRERCTIVPPYWMNVQTLEQLKKDERQNHLFTKMPSEHYMAITSILFRRWSQDIPDADRVKLLIKDIWDNRIAKLRTNIMVMIDEGGAFAKVDNLTQLEMVTVRPFFPHALEQLHRVRQTAKTNAEIIRITREEEEEKEKEAKRLESQRLESQRLESQNSE